MKRLTTLLFFFVALLPVYAQTVNQQGIVKDICYSLGQEGEPISDVKLKVMVETRSDTNGVFYIPVPLNINRVFTFENIQKDGYELISPNREKLSQTEFAVNSSAKVIIVMASKSKLYQERRRIENKIRQSYSKEIERMSRLIDNLTAQRDSLIKLSADVSNIVEQIKKTQNELDDYINNYYDADMDILERATKLSRIDYQTIDEAEAAVYELMKQGKGVDAAIASRNRLSPEIWEMVSSNPLCLKHKRDMAQRMLDDTRKIVRATSDGYSMAFQHDSAAYYLKLYADMDPSDFIGQLEYADYLYNTLDKYEEAETYVNFVLERADSLAYESILAKSYQANILATKGKEHEAEAAYKQALSWSRIINSNELIYTLLNNLGSFYSSRQMLDESEELLLEALKLKLKTGAQIDKVCHGYIELADLYTRKNVFEKTYEYLVNCPEPEDEIRYIELYDAKANYYSAIGSYDEAIRYYLLAEEKAKAYYGPVNRTAASIYSNIAQTYLQIGQYQKAEEYLKASISITERLIGKDNLHYYVQFYGLCQFYIVTARYTEAVEGFNEIIAKAYGNHFANGLLAHAYTDIAVAYQDLSEFDKAEESLQKALEFSLSTYGEINDATTAIYNNLGSLYIDQQKYDLAIEYFNKSLIIGKEIYGADSPELITYYCNLASTYLKNNNSEEGLKMYYEAIRIGQLNHSNPLKLSYIYNNLSTYFHNNRQFETALEYSKKALELRERTDDYLLTVGTITNLALIYEKLSDYDKAIETFDYMIEYSNKHIGEDTKDLAYAYYKRGAYYYLKENYDVSLSNANEAHRIYRQLLGEENNATIAAQALVETCSSEMSPHVYIADVIDGYAASEKGFSGQYIILSVNEKNILNKSNLISYLQTLPKETPKEILLMDFDFNIRKLELESVGIGAYLNIKIVSKSFQNRVIKEYKAYLKKRQ